MRADAIGLFWQDLPKPPPVKREPPARTWEEAGYLPRLEEAREFARAHKGRLIQKNEPLLFDIEVYPNYFLLAFMGVESGAVWWLEMQDDEWGPNKLDSEFSGVLSLYLKQHPTITFNGNAFDLPIAALALAGRTTSELKACSDALISELVRPNELLRRQHVDPLAVDTIDLFNVAPGKMSLKLYAARLHARRLQELPFRPDTVLSQDQIDIVRLYCCKFDLPATKMLYEQLKPQIALRAQIGPLYGLELRSKSDAQMAEALLCSEIERETGRRPQRPEIPAGTTFRYQTPSFIEFQTPAMQAVLATVEAAEFVVREEGGVGLPPALESLEINLGEATYTMGIGGLHSNEKSVARWSDEKTLLIDRDVASYYPAIILNLGLYPKHIGPAFLTIYRRIVERRLKAKAAGNKVEADTLKIAVNGTFGKLGSKWSPLYSPDLLIQVTLTGQLALLMLIEKLEASGFPVRSANTDGFLIESPRDRSVSLRFFIAAWEKRTGFQTEETHYRFLCARDVNSYIAVKTDGKLKLKGLFAEESVAKNPAALICNDAVIAFLKDGVGVETTVRGCTDIRRFVTVRTVNGGAVKDGEYLGKAIRWYFSTKDKGEIIYATTGNMVANSECSKPLMELPDTLPDDLDFERYITTAKETLNDIGVNL